MELVFESIEALYQRLKPALRTKKEELKREGYGYIADEDIWNYLKESKWKNAKNLLLHDMVSDILSSDHLLIDQYVKEKLNKQERIIYFNGGNNEK